MAYAYTPLARHHIRILELQPPPGPLVCTLRTQLIASAPYEALSYVWGKPTSFTGEITVSDDRTTGALSIGANLETALYAYRTRNTRRLWVDAICIRQDDTTEREGQVAVMGSIFRNATRVICWLGPFTRPSDADTARLAIGFIREFNEDQETHLRAVQRHFGGSHDDAIARTWAAVKIFFDIEYFHRAWIIQEIGLARLARLSWGHSGVSVDWPEIARFVSFLDDNGASIINQLDLKSWVCDHVNLVWSTDARGNPNYDFSEVLHWARVHRSTDSRDYVFSLLGHPSAVVDGALLIQPDYVSSTAQVYTRLAVTTITRTQNLHILAFVDHGEDPPLLDLPSWVPDWHVLNLVAPLRYTTMTPTKPAPTETIIIRDDKVYCRGSIIGAISAFSHMISPKELAVTDYDAEMRKSIPFLMDHLHETLAAPPERFINALSMVLTGSVRGTGSAGSGIGMHQQRADCAAYALSYDKLRHTPSSFAASLTEEKRRDLETLAASGSDTQFIQDMTWTSMCRRVFCTADGHIGLGPRILQRGDVCAVVRGSLYPFVLRPVGSEYQLVGPALVDGLMNHGGGDDEICIR